MEVIGDPRESSPEETVLHRRWHLIGEFGKIWEELRLTGFGGGMEWEVEVSRCKLLYIERINNKVLLYSPENYIKYPKINHNGKEYIYKK